MAKAPALHARGSGFESPPGRKFSVLFLTLVILPVKLVVGCRVYVVGVGVGYVTLRYGNMSSTITTTKITINSKEFDPDRLI